jgi:hypothetical protein
MAEKKFTEAGQAGQRLKAALANAYRGFNSGFTKYVQEPALNFYPQVIANPTYAATEAVAGAFDTPLDLGRFPYYNIETEDERNKRLIKESEPPEPKATLANRDLLSEYYGGFDNVPVRKAEAVSKKNKPLNYVVKTYGENPTSEIFTDKEKAKAALKSLYAKNQKATMSNVPEDQAQEFAVGSMEKVAKNKEAIRRLRNPQTEAEIMAVEQNKLRMADALDAANKSKLAKDKEAGAGFESWRSDVKARRMSEDDFNAYNQRLDLLRQAYSNAKSSGRLKEAYDISMDIDDFQAGIPKEMGARRKEIERRTLATRNALLADQERSARIQAANPDYINPFNKTIGMRYQ